jgi:DNA-binding NtrC family response regulator
MITAHGSERIAVQAIARGADDYLPKPFDNDELRLVVARNLARSRLAREHRELLERVARAEALLPPIDPEQVSFSDAKRRVVTAFERAYLLGALRRNGGNVSRTARTIGMVRQSLQQKIREHDLRSEDWKQAS